MHEMAERVRREGVDVMRKTRLYPAHSRRLDARSRELLVRDFERLTADGVAGTAESLVVDVNCFERLGELRVPTLVVLGDRDADFVKNAPPFVNRLPAGYVYTARLDGAGHAANIEQPEAFAQTLLTFASEIGVLDAATAAAPTKGRNFSTMALTTVGAALVMGGIALLTAAFLTGGSIQRRARPGSSAEHTDTEIGDYSDRHRGCGSADCRGFGDGGGAGSDGRNGDAHTAGGNSHGDVGADARASECPSPPPPTPTPTETPTPTATPTVPPTPTPSGPLAAISGPGSGSPGDTLTFFDASRPPESVQQRVWSAGSVAEIVPNLNPAAAVVKFPESGCYTVSLTISMRGVSSTFTASHRVAIGGAICE